MNSGYSTECEKKSVEWCCAKMAPIVLYLPHWVVVRAFYTRILLILPVVISRTDKSSIGTENTNVLNMSGAARARRTWLQWCVPSKYMTRTWAPGVANAAGSTIVHWHLGQVIDGLLWTAITDVGTTCLCGRWLENMASLPNDKCYTGVSTAQTSGIMILATANPFTSSSHRYARFVAMRIGTRLSGNSLIFLTLAPEEASGPLFCPLVEFPEAD